MSRSTPRPFEARLLTALSSLIPKQPQSVVLHGVPDLDDGTLALLHVLIERGYRPSLLLNGPLPHAMAALVPVGATAVLKDSMQGRWRFLRAETVFTTHDVYRSHDPPASQMYVNIWHGEPVGKIGLRWEGDLPPGATWVTASSPLGAAFRGVEFGLPPDRVKVLGAPRNDRLLNADVKMVRARTLPSYCQKLLLWLPTYRIADGVRVDGTPFESVVPLDDSGLRLLDEWLIANDAVLMTMPHRHRTDQIQVAGHERIKLISDEWLAQRQLTLYQLIAAADVQITDISSVWADFLLTQKPIVFHFPDIDEYRTSRGLHLEPFDAWAPGPITTIADELLSALSEAIADDHYASSRAEMRRLMHTHVDGRSAMRILDAAGLRGFRMTR